MNSMTHFISEVSSNHFRDLDRCIKFIDKSADIGCDSVKFQLFKINELFSKEAFIKKPEILNRKEWELPLDFFPSLKQRCVERKIELGCTPFYLKAVKEIYDYVDYYKIASYELLWDSLIEACAETKKKIIISTGMANIKEVMHAVDLCQKKGVEPIVLHCNSSYPSPIKDVNLSAIKTIRDITNCSVGWSDHSVSTNVIMLAIYKWSASHIEFHLDLDGKGEEFSTGHCWLPDNIQKIIRYIRESDIISGSGVKQPSESEHEERLWRADPDDGLRPLKKTRDLIG